MKRRSGAAVQGAAAAAAVAVSAAATAPVGAAVAAVAAVMEQAQMRPSENHPAKPHQQTLLLTPGSIPLCHEEARLCDCSVRCGGHRRRVHRVQWEAHITEEAEARELVQRARREGEARIIAAQRQQQRQQQHLLARATRSAKAGSSHSLTPPASVARAPVQWKGARLLCRCDRCMRLARGDGRLVSESTWRLHCKVQMDSLRQELEQQEAAQKLRLESGESSGVEGSVGWHLDYGEYERPAADSEGESQSVYRMWDAPFRRRDDDLYLNERRSGSWRAPEHDAEGEDGDGSEDESDSEGEDDEGESSMWISDKEEDEFRDAGDEDLWADADEESEEYYERYWEAVDADMRAAAAARARAGTGALRRRRLGADATPRPEAGRGESAERLLRPGTTANHRNGDPSRPDAAAGTVRTNAGGEPCRSPGHSPSAAAADAAAGAAAAAVADAAPLRSRARGHAAAAAAANRLVLFNRKGGKDGSSGSKKKQADESGVGAEGDARKGGSAAGLESQSGAARLDARALPDALRPHAEKRHVKEAEVRPEHEQRAQLSPLRARRQRQQQRMQQQELSPPQPPVLAKREQGQQEAPKQLRLPCAWNMAHYGSCCDIAKKLTAANAAAVVAAAAPPVASDGITDRRGLPLGVGATEAVEGQIGGVREGRRRERGKAVEGGEKARTRSATAGPSELPMLKAHEQRQEQQQKQQQQNQGPKRLQQQEMEDNCDRMKKVAPASQYLAPSDKLLLQHTAVVDEAEKENAGAFTLLAPAAVAGAGTSNITTRAAARLLLQSSRLPQQQQQQRQQQPQQQKASKGNVAAEVVGGGGKAKGGRVLPQRRNVQAAVAGCEQEGKEGREVRRAGDLGGRSDARKRMREGEEVGAGWGGKGCSVHGDGGGEDGGAALNGRRKRVKAKAGVASLR